MFRFANKELLLLLLLIPVLYLVFRIGMGMARKKMRRFGEAGVIGRLMPDVSGPRPGIKFILYLLATSFVILAMARPQFGTKLQEMKRKGIEIIIALDVSNSMMAQDIEPNRLEKAKQAISRMVDRLRDDRIGLIVFAGRAYTQIPVTNDYASAKMFLSSISPGVVPVQGTSISSAIELAIRSYSPTEDMNRALVIITDGENHEDDPVAMAEQAAQEGIKVYTIGIGLPQGTPIPAGSGSNDFMKDKDGNVVISKLDEKILQQIAAAADGKYIRANNTRIGLNALFEDIEEIEKKKIEARVYSEYEDIFQYPVALALIILIVEYLLLERKNRKLKHISVFGINK